ncbi:MAG: putative niacin/nicotinamide transporter NaiP [Syntrophorhabdus sp. PtaU1.Bin002]|nr:MAG: putative niacin/nicotinamide transporter NaiP [Syntrophorhabdus sp. PtaU1.Bin002]
MATATILNAKEPISRMGMLVTLTTFIVLVCDGLDLQLLALALPVLMDHFHLNKVLAGLTSTGTLVGMLFGGILAGWLSDRWGRVRVVAYSVVVFAIGNSLLAFTQNFWQFAIVRFCSGFGMAGAYSVSLMLACEYIPTSRRNFVLGVLQSGWSIGYIVAALLTVYILPKWGWRPLFFISFVPAVLAFILTRFCEEPPSWRAAQQTQSAVGRSSEWANIFSDKRARTYFFLWLITSFFLQAGFYGAGTWMPTYIVKELGVNLKSMGWFIAMSYTMMVVGKVIAGWLGDRFGRKIVYVLFGLGTAAAIPLIMHYATASSIAYYLLVFGFLYGTPFAIVNTYMNESFATSVRGTAVATAYNAGRIGSIIAPVAIGMVATSFSLSYALAFLGAMYALSAVLPGLFIPEKMYDPKAVDKAPVANASCSEVESP